MKGVYHAKPFENVHDKKCWFKFLSYICHLLSWRNLQNVCWADHYWQSIHVEGDEFVHKLFLPNTNEFCNFFMVPPQNLAWKTYIFGFKYLSGAKFCGGPPIIWIFLGVLIANIRLQRAAICNLAHKHCVRCSVWTNFQVPPLWRSMCAQCTDICQSEITCIHIIGNLKCAWRMLTFLIKSKVFLQNMSQTQITWSILQGNKPCGDQIWFKEKWPWAKNYKTLSQVEKKN